MQQDKEPLGGERDLDEAAHEQLEDSENKPLGPTTPSKIIEQEHDLDDEAHRQLEDSDSDSEDI